MLIRLRKKTNLLLCKVNSFSFVKLSCDFVLLRLPLIWEIVNVATLAVSSCRSPVDDKQRPRQTVVLNGRVPQNLDDDNIR